MARRKKSSVAEDLIDLVALLPWWAGAIIALVSYWLLHSVATSPPPSLSAAQPTGPLFATVIWQALATAGQYVLPVLCLVGAVVSVMRRRQRCALFEATAASSLTDALERMSWQEFELLVGEGFKRRGYAVKEMGGAGADGGIDLILHKKGEKYFVQCKQWKAVKVGVTTVRELYGVMAAHGARGGFVVTSGRFTREAAAFAHGRNLQLIDGTALMQLLREARSTPRADHTPSPETEPVAHLEASNTATAAVISTASTPPCPKCHKPMVRRTAKRGPNEGGDFWGCQDFSAGCRGTRKV